MYPKLSSANVINLSSSVKVYVPSTIDVDKSTDNAAMVEHVSKVLSGLFGGSTAYQAIGGWVAQDGALVTERVTIVQSFCTSDGLDANIDAVLALAHHVKIAMSQEAVSLEVNNELYLV